MSMVHFIGVDQYDGTFLSLFYFSGFVNLSYKRIPTHSSHKILTIMEQSENSRKQSFQFMTQCVISRCGASIHVRRTIHSSLFVIYLLRLSYYLQRRRLCLSLKKLILFQPPFSVPLKEWWNLHHVVQIILQRCSPCQWTERCYHQQWFDSFSHNVPPKF